MNDLIKRAKEESRPKEKITKEHAELVVAYLNDEVTIRGVAKAMELKGAGNVSFRLGRILREGVKNGWIRIQIL